MTELWLLAALPEGDLTLAAWAARLGIAPLVEAIARQRGLVG